MRVVLNQMVPSSDGVNLATDTYMPSTGRNFPTILIRTPYNKMTFQTYAKRFVDRGYAFVAQDVRGKYESEGTFVPLEERVDGQETIAWIAERAWCDGNIGLWGTSYEGIVQVPAAIGGHEALKAMAPAVHAASSFRDFVRRDGCFALANMLKWPLIKASTRTLPAHDHFDWNEMYGFRSLDDVEAHVGFQSPLLRDWARRDHYDEYWKSVDQSLMYERVAVPGHHGGGWFDHLTRGQFTAYCGIRDRGATEKARCGQRLLIGPWGHDNFGIDDRRRRHYGDVDFGPDADVSVVAHEMQFFDHHLRGLDSGIDPDYPVKLFIQGSNRWEVFSDWPPPDADLQEWYLQSTSGANLLMGGGELTQELGETEDAVTLHSDPNNPVPTLGGPVFWGLDLGGPRNQRHLLDRRDVLTYRSYPMSDPMLVIGEVSLQLWISADVDDIDVIAKFCVEYEDTGDILPLTWGSLRCKFRNSWSQPHPLPKSEPVRVDVQLGHTAADIPEGSRLVLLLMGTDFPQILPNPHTMTAPWESTTPRVAATRVLQGGLNASRLLVPTISTRYG